ncbi:ABC transporter permease [Emticicia sp. TH156]|uniref:ABC transporter permease n=1 Tax=Emticicia sp. TH156 TaxID=2067454 RepID=UPI000C77BE0E|nr:ABC transporter permease [Emticicia sp. TH156]PLK46095.1 ABC transporter permease [Emticicia sp. TH156]
MDLKISFQIAKTHLLTKKKQTLIAMLGVTFGIAMFIVMISFIKGVNKFLEDSALDATPHVRIYKEITSNHPSLIDEVNPGAFNVIHHQLPKNELANIKSGLQIVANIEKDPAVLGVSPQISSQVFFNKGPIPVSGQISGVEILKEDKIYNIRKRIKSGSMDDLLSNPNGILMGTILARNLNVKVGDKLTVTTPTGNLKLVKVVGVYGFGIQTVDGVKCYANMSMVQEILQKDKSYVTDIHIKMKDSQAALDYAKVLKTQYGYKTQDWAEANSAFMSGDKIRNAMVIIVSITLLVVAGFGIYNIMNMNVVNKMKDIAILKATGFGGKDIVAVFLIQSIIIGVLGALLGIIIGFGLSYLLSKTPFDAGDFLDVKTFPVIFNIKYYIMGLGFGVITTILAGYFPARKAAKIDPVAILRG